MREKRKESWLMLALVAPIVIVGIVVLYFGAKDVESHREPQPTEYNIDSLRQVERNLRTLEDSVHFYEDGL
mgnify:CR=1 FL=1